MKKKQLSLVIWLSLFLILILAPHAQSNPTTQSQTINPSSQNEQVDVIVWLKDGPVHATLGQSKLARAAKEKQLKSGSAAAQKNILAKLAELKKNKKISSYNSFWLINAVHVKGNREALSAIAKVAEIERISLNSKLSIPPVTSSPISALSSPSEWGIDKIRADKVQDDLGLDGSGVIIGHIDTGYDPDHPDLAGKLAGWAEFDESGNQVPGSTPHDSDTHGTHTAGTLVGGDAGGTRIGVAPGATVLSALALPQGSASFAQVIGAMEWVVDPDLNPLTDDGAKVVSMSFGGYGTNNDIADAILNMQALDAVPVASIGNCGEDCTGNPGNVPGSVGVGATDSSDLVADFSSGGTVTWNYPPYVGNYVKPDISAPGVDVLSAIPGGGYDSYSGTSMAAPHAAGSIALMRQADPSMSAEELKLFDQLSVVDLGDEGKDTRYGYGRIDSFTAVSNVLNAATLSGVIEGNDNGSLTPIEANIRFLDIDLTKRSEPTAGAYSAKLPAGTYDVRFSAYGYVSETAQVVLTPNTTTTLNVILDLAPIRTISGTVYDLDTGLPLSATADLEFSIEDEPSTVQISTSTNPSTGMYELDIPEGDYLVNVDAIGYDALNSELTISSDATINFSLEKAPDILLVNASLWSPDAYFVEILDKLNVDYRVIEKLEKSINFSILEDYRDVIWFTADNFVEPVSETEQEALASFMDGGGNLFITGSEIGWNLVEIGFGETFFQDYLHAQYVSDYSSYEDLYGATGSINEGLNINIGMSGDSAQNNVLPDEILPATADSEGQPDSSAIDSFIYGSPETDEIKNDGAIQASTDTNKMVYFSFGLDGVDTFYAREILMRNVLNYFGYELPVPILRYAPLQLDLKSTVNSKFSKRFGVGNIGSGDLEYELSTSYCKTNWNDQVLDQSITGPQRSSYYESSRSTDKRSISINSTDPANNNGSELLLSDANEKDVVIDLKTVKIRSDNDNINFRLTGYTDLLGGSGDSVEIAIPIDEDRDRNTGFPWDNSGIDKVVSVYAENGEIIFAWVYTAGSFGYDLMDSTTYNAASKTLNITMPVCVINNHDDMNFYAYVADYVRNKTDYAPDDTFFNAFSIHPDWLTLGNVDGHAGERSGDVVKLNFNTTGLKPDSYDATITIKNNANIESTVPLKLRVRR